MQGLTARNILKNTDSGLILVVNVDASADGDVQQDDKGGSQGRDEEVELGALGLLLGHERAKSADAIEHDQRAQTEGGVQLSLPEVLESINDDSVRSGTGVDTLDAHKLGDLAGSNVDGGARHEGADRGQGNDLDDPANSGEAEERDNRTNHDSKSRGNHMALNIRDHILGMEYHIACDLRHDSDGLENKGQLGSFAGCGENGLTYSNGDVLGSSKEPIDEDTHKGRVQPILDGELGELGVSHGLGDDNSAHSDTYRGVEVSNG